MPGPQLSAISTSQHESLSEAALNLVSRIPQLLCRLRDLENEEAKLDAQARQLVGQLPTTNTKDRPPKPIVSTPVSKLRIQSPKRAVGRGTPCTPPPINPSTYFFSDLINETSNVFAGNFETPVRAFLLMESFALAMSVRSKRKGRLFMGGDSTEFGERR